MRLNSSQSAVFPVLGFVGLMFSSCLIAQSNPAKDLASKDVATRLHGISTLVAEGAKDAERHLGKACRDKDWEVVLRATEALKTLGTKKSAKVLTGLCLKHPLAAVREAAADALIKLDQEKTPKSLAKGLKGKTKVRAAEALVRVGDPQGQKRFLKMAKGEDKVLARLGVGALWAVEEEKAQKALVGYLSNGDVAVREAAAAALGRRGDNAALQALITRLGSGECVPLMERRLGKSIVLVATGRRGDPRAKALTLATGAAASATAEKGKAAAIRMLGRLVGALEDDTERKAAVESMVTLASSKSKLVLSTLAAELGRVESEAAAEALIALSSGDQSDAVRAHALRALTNHKLPSVAKHLMARLTAESSEAHRELCAVACGKALIASSAPALMKALQDSSWKVVLASAISLGKLQSEEAVPELSKLLGHDSFRNRASAAAGLGICGRKAAIPHLIKALDDKDSLVRDTAHDYLQRLTNHKLDPKAAKWQKWWGEHSGDFSFNDRAGAKRSADKRKEEGYDTFRGTPYDAFRDFLVIVLSQSRDKMEKTLEALKIEHVLTRTSKIKESGINPNAAFLANCPGQINDDDALRLEWFVRSGGHLFSTCVALNNTVGKLFPNTLRAPAARAGAQAGEMGISAKQVEGENAYMDGVFDEHSRPVYQLAGPLLPIAVDRNLVHVLIDSSEACTQWGSGNLAAWFPAGHGLVVHSANHFVLQGMARLKTSAERKAYALERLGISFRQLRKLEAKGAFKSHNAAVKACTDETMMRLIARFIYTKRRNSF